MKFLHGLFALLLYAVILFSGCYLIYMGQMGDIAWWHQVQLLIGERITATAAGFALVFLLLLFMLTATKKKEAEKFISFPGEGGAISISMVAVREFVRRVGDEFPSVLSIHPAIRSRGAAVDIELDLRVRSGTQVPDLCKMMQDRVRETLHENIGLSHIRSVKVNVREIVNPATEARQDLDADF